MKFRNHYKMGRQMYKAMAENGIQLNEAAFVLGNLAPDMSLSCFYSRHSREHSERRMARPLARLYGGDYTNDSLVFSYSLGVMSHYICDFLCYSHTPAFKGDIQEHIRHEKYQAVSAAGMLPFNVQENAGMDLPELKARLDAYISQQEQLLAQNPELAQNDVFIAMHAAAWASTGVWLHAGESTAAINAPYRSDSAMIAETCFKALALAARSVYTPVRGKSRYLRQGLGLVASGVRSIV